ncbi:MAG TPA: hypothetical protein VFK35_06915 [Candidatus Limnocylindrales bacterium]|nr:hypothetical protein [Candidatus Limnocylindrales bacterium]
MAVLRRFAPDALAGLFAVSGALHLVRPGMFDPLIPPFLPVPGAVITLSGIAELVCAAGLARRDRWAAPVSAALLVAIVPGNLWFAVATPDGPRPGWLTAAAWARLPFQLVLIWMALQARPARLDTARPSIDTPNDR